MALGIELLEMTLSMGMFARRAVSLDFPLSAKWLLCCQNLWCAWCQRKVNSHLPFLRSSLGTALSPSSGSFPADTSSRPQQGVSLVAVAIASTPPLIPSPPLSFTKVQVVLDWPVSAWRYFEGGTGTLAQYFIKTVTLCHHPT